MSSAVAHRGLAYAVHAGLALVLLTPLVWAPMAFYPFAVGKAVHARSLIAITFALWTILALRSPRHRPPPSAILAALAFSLAVAAVSAWCGVSPQRSLWSTYTRMEGLVDLAHWFAFALMLAATVRDAKGWDRLLNFNLGVGLLAALPVIVRYQRHGKSITGRASPARARRERSRPYSDRGTLPERVP